MSNPTEFLSRVGYRQVQAAASGTLTPGRNISGVFFDGSVDITLSTTGITEGTNLYFTNERAQDAVGTILTNTATITLTYNDAGNLITADIPSDVALPGNPTTTTQSPLTNDNTIATTAYVDLAIVAAVEDYTMPFLFMGA
jgi:hypothetical protein